MEIKNQNILILGATGLMGRSILKKILVYNPVKIELATLDTPSERKKANRLLRLSPKIKEIYYGNIFQENLNKTMWSVSSPKRIHNTFLTKIINNSKPDIIIDCINTCTALTRKGENLNGYSAQDAIILHVLDLFYSISNLKKISGCTPKIYLKVGTTGTGGLGLDIPFTHGDEIASLKLYEKTAISGAHSALLLLLSRTKGMPKIKEVKPALAVFEDAPTLSRPNEHKSSKELSKIGQVLKIIKRQSTSQILGIDGGESGLYGLEELKLLTHWMKCTTSSLVAEMVVKEILQESGAHNVTEAINKSLFYKFKGIKTLGGQLVKLTEKLTTEKKVESISAGNLGPPRIQKLLFESSLIIKTLKADKNLEKKKIDEAVKIISGVARKDLVWQKSAVAVGIPILLSDGKTLISANYLQVPSEDLQGVRTSERKVDLWAQKGWVDLRRENISLWLKRLRRLKKLRVKTPSRFVEYILLEENRK